MGFFITGLLGAWLALQLRRVHRLRRRSPVCWLGFTTGFYMGHWSVVCTDRWFLFRLESFKPLTGLDWSPLRLRFRPMTTTTYRVFFAVFSVPNCLSDSGRLVNIVNFTCTVFSPQSRVFCRPCHVPATSRRWPEFQIERTTAKFTDLMPLSYVTRSAVANESAPLLPGAGAHSESSINNSIVRVGRAYRTCRLAAEQP